MRHAFSKVLTRRLIAVLFAGAVRALDLLQDILERPILIENVSSYMAFADSTMPEWEFISAIANEADCIIDNNFLFAR